jgi:hypothetical protein
MEIIPFKERTNKKEQILDKRTRVHSANISMQIGSCSILYYQLINKQREKRKRKKVLQSMSID